VPFQLGHLTIEIVEGDITAQPVDAVVNAANNALWMGSGVAGAIKSRGGSTIERDAIAQGPISVGESVVTGGGALQARHVIHAAVMGQDLRTSEALIARATTSALAAASRLGIESVAFPALGTGVGGFPLDRCAEIMINSVRAHARAHGAPRTGVRGGVPTNDGDSLRRVVFVLFGQPAFETFAHVAHILLAGPRSESDASDRSQ
jgi:O-acetyl-ADP-ribose deacetylase (regulator of RNase III)